jgi:hypothetical protein
LFKKTTESLSKGCRNKPKQWIFFSEPYQNACLCSDVVCWVLFLIFATSWGNLWA